MDHTAAASICSEVTKEPIASQLKKASKRAGQFRCVAHGLFTLAVFLLDNALLGVVSSEGSNLPRWLAITLIVCACVASGCLYRHAKYIMRHARNLTWDENAVPSSVHRKQVPTQAKVVSSITDWTNRINGASKDGDILAAERVILEMKRVSLSPDITCYNAMIMACTKCGEPKRAEQWLEQMQAASIEPNVISYNILMDFCAKRGDSSGA